MPWVRSTRRRFSLVRFDEDLVRRLGRRRGAAAGLAAERTSLIDGRFEIALAIAKGNPPLANQQAAIRLAFDAAIHRDKLVGGAFDLNDAVDQDLAAAVHRYEIG